MADGESMHGCLISSNCPFYIVFWVAPSHTRRNYPLIFWARNQLFFFFPSFSSSFHLIFVFLTSLLSFAKILYLGREPGWNLRGGCNLWVGRLRVQCVCIWWESFGRWWEGEGVCGRESADEESVGGTIGKWEILWWGSGRAGVFGGGGQGCMVIGGRWWSLYGWEVCLWQCRISENLWIH
jgi:hypothetical protein